MTGYTVHTGSNEKFTTGYDGIFKKQPAKQPKKAAAAKKSSKPRKKK